MQDLMAIYSNKGTQIENYQIVHIIGEGRFATVKLARRVVTGTEVALKVIKKWKQSFSSLQELFREINSMKLLDHANTVKILDFTDTEDSTITVMDYMRGGDAPRPG